MPRRRSSKKPSHTFITSNKGKNLLVIDDYIYNHTKISSNVRTFIKTLKKEEVVSRQLMLKSSSGNQKRKTKAILALEVRLKYLVLDSKTMKLIGNNILRDSRCLWPIKNYH